MKGEGNTVIFRVKSKQTDSQMWKGLLKARDELLDGFRFRMGNGHTSVWYADWSGEGKAALHVPFVNIVDTETRLCDIVQHKAWNLDCLYTELPQVLKEKLTRIKLDLHASNVDAWIWENSSTGIYTVRDAYKWLNNRLHDGMEIKRWSWVWRLQALEKLRFFIWTVLHGAIQTNSFRFRRSEEHTSEL